MGYGRLGEGERLSDSSQVQTISRDIQAFWALLAVFFLLHHARRLLRSSDRATMGTAGTAYRYPASNPKSMLRGGTLVILREAVWCLALVHALLLLLQV